MKRSRSQGNIVQQLKINKNKKILSRLRAIAMAAWFVAIALLYYLNSNNGLITTANVTDITEQKEEVIIEKEVIIEEIEESVVEKANNSIETKTSEPRIINKDKFFFYTLDDGSLPDMKKQTTPYLSFASRQIDIEQSEEINDTYSENDKQQVEVEVQYINLDKDIEKWRENVVKEALSHIGQIDYVWGGEDLEDGSDCSGFIWAVYDAVGLGDYFGHRRSCQSIFEKIEKGKYILLQPYEGALPGDIILYHNSDEYLEEHPDKSEYGHCAIYIGNGEVVHMIGKGCVRTPVVFDSTRTNYLMLRVIINDKVEVKEEKENIEENITENNNSIEENKDNTDKKDKDTKKKKDKSTKKETEEIEDDIEDDIEEVNEVRIEEEDSTDESSEQYNIKEYLVQA